MDGGEGVGVFLSSVWVNPLTSSSLLIGVSVQNEVYPTLNPSNLTQKTCAYCIRANLIRQTSIMGEKRKRTKERQENPAFRFSSCYLMLKGRNDNLVPYAFMKTTREQSGANTV